MSRPKKNRYLKFPTERSKYSRIRASSKKERMAMKNCDISEALDLFTDNFNSNITFYLRSEKNDRMLTG